MGSVYLETSFVSACVATRTDVTSIYRRELSTDWWDQMRSRHQLCTSAEVIRELSDDRYPNRAAALAQIEGIPLLDLNDDVIGLARLLIRERVMPAPAAGDAIHIAAATVHGIDYMLSWNVRHLANPGKVKHLQVICVRAGYVPPLVVTPDYLWEDD